MDLAFQNSWNPETGQYNGFLNFTHFDTELARKELSIQQFFGISSAKLSSR